MATDLWMPAPICLIENSKGQLTVKQEAVQVLATITQPVVVVAIVGLYRTGKSYLMNKLAGQRSGFSLGSTVQSHTKGIWMWCVPHPKKPNHTLVLLDTEGLGDVEKGDNKNDTWIFALAVLLSSTFVYNSMGTINQQAMDQLHYVTELTQRVRVSTAEVEDSTNFVNFFPDFVWTVRDFTLELKINGQPITSDEYLEKALKLKEGTSDGVHMFNLPRQCIHQFFPKKKCFIFEPPTHGKKLAQHEKLHDSELEADFVEQTETFCSYIFQHSKVKTVHGGITVNGPRLEILVLTYVKAITSGDMPCMENAVLALAQIENSAAVQKALTHYEEMMKQRVQFPTDTLRELLDIHATCEREATEVFIKDSFKDVDQKFQKELMSQLEARRDAFCNQNLNESAQCCRVLLQDIFRPLEEGVKQGAFSKPGGYGFFLQKKQELIVKYSQQPKKGVQAEETLQEYLKSKEDIAKTIEHTDQALTAKEKEIVAERTRAQAAEAASRQLEELQKRDQKIQEQKKSHLDDLKEVPARVEAEVNRWRKRVRKLF
ncbi:guanylate-binding protein 1-like [Petaurus breviceps papuanus]|uniref:guanylate-binding protein 1-like n=1 Tax=Petaurus breviceps papuanus TaxID=3040969 RepID=UPI0036D8FA41